MADRDPDPPTPVQRSFQLWIAASSSASSAVPSRSRPPRRPRARSRRPAASSASSSACSSSASLVYLALRLRAGDHWARLALTILGGISAVFTVLGVLLTAGLGVTIGAVSTIVSLVQAALIVAAILFAFQAPANAYFR